MEINSRVVKLLKNAGTFYFATNDADRPRVRPYNAVMEFEDKVYFYTNNHKTAYAQMQSCPRIELCAMVDDDGSRWLRVSGDVVFDDRVEAKRAMLEENPKLKNIYDENDKIFEVFYLENMIAKIHSLTSAPETIN